MPTANPAPAPKASGGVGDALTAPFPLCSCLSHSVLHGVFAPKTLEPPNSQGHWMGLVPNGGVPGSPQHRCSQGPCSQHKFIPLNPPPALFFFSFLNGKAANRAGCTPCLRGSSQRDGNHSARASRQEKNPPPSPPQGRPAMPSAPAARSIPLPRVPVPASWQQEPRAAAMVSLSPALEAAAAQQPSKGLNPTAAGVTWRPRGFISPRQPES